MKLGRNNERNIDTNTHTTIAHTDNQKTQNTPPVLIEQFLALFIDNKLELLEFNGGLGTILKSLGKLMQP